MEAYSRNAAYMREAYRKLRADHSCTKCGVKLADDWPYVMCASCKEARRVYYRKYRELCRMLGRCPGCGRPVGDKTHVTCEICREHGKISAKKRRERSKT